MEPAAAGYWMWSNNKRKHGDLSNPYDDSSWEEQAFAEDAAGALGGCVWPPRSYSCSFCQREFRSAQALGGHMNVHRRDRARLKQSSSSSSSLSPQNEIIHHHDDHHRAVGTFHQYPSHHLDHQKLCSFVSNPNPISSSPSSTSRVSGSLLPPPPPPNVTQKNCPDDSRRTLLANPSPIVLQEQQQQRQENSKPSPWSNLVAEKNYSSRIDAESAAACRVYKEDYVQTDLSVSLNLVVRRTRSPALSSSDHGNTEKEEATSSTCKRRIIISEASTTAIPFLLMKPCSLTDDDLDHHHHQSEDQEHKVVLTIPASSIEDLDLELRLGDPPKVIK